MPRIKSGTTTHKRHKKLLEMAKGYVGSKGKLYRVASEQILHSLHYAYRDRRNRKRDFRRLWITRINAAAHLNNSNYRSLIAGLKQAKVQLNRKMLALLSVESPNLFKKITLIATKNFKPII